MLLDIGLPEMNGYEVAKTLRSLPALNGIRLIALTGYGQAVDRERTQLAGFDEHLMKPVDSHALEQALGCPRKGYGRPMRHQTREPMKMQASSRPELLRVGVGGPVGSGKTALVDLLCKRLRDRLDIAVVTNDIYTREDAEFLIRSQALPAERIRGVETGGCPHTAIREDASMNLAAIDALMREFRSSI